MLLMNLYLVKNYHGYYYLHMINNDTNKVTMKEHLKVTLADLILIILYVYLQVYI